jgi:hypothetical protein
LNFSALQPFGPNESLDYAVYAPDNTLLGSGAFSSGDSAYTSGLLGALTLSVFPSPALDATNFYATVTSTAGSFDLIGGQADLYNFAGGSQLGSIGAVVAVPELRTWALFATGLGALGLLRNLGLGRRRRSRLACQP